MFNEATLSEMDVVNLGMTSTTTYVDCMMITPTET